MSFSTHANEVGTVITGDGSPELKQGDFDPHHRPVRATTERLDPVVLRPIIQRAAKETGLHPALIESVIKTGSHFRPRAMGQNGGRGLMLIPPAIAKQRAMRNVLDPQENIFVGARYLKQLLEQFGSVRLAVAALHAGPQAVEKADGSLPRDHGTRDFVSTVLRRYSNARSTYMSFKRH